jgi:membrane protease YdiL (CAAX protease family)
VGQEVTPMMAALGAVAMLVLTAGLFCWTLTALRVAIGWQVLPKGLTAVGLDVLKQFGVPSSLPLIAWQPRRPVPWGVVDLIAVLLIFVGATALAALAVQQGTGIPSDRDFKSLTLTQSHALIGANMATSLAVLAAGLALIAVRVSANASDLGLLLAGGWRNVRLGLIGFVMLAPPVYALQRLLVYLWKPSEHPIMEMFKQSPGLALYGLLFAAAVIVAPVVEEMLFRVLLQGFLEKAASGHVSPRAIVLGGEDGVRQDTMAVQLASPLALDRSPLDPNPYAPPKVPAEFPPGDLAPPTAFDQQPEFRGLRAWTPIAISSLIFALLHYSHGPDWVPLTLLAAGMGYLYQRTHSVIPSLVVHLCLNGLSMWGLWVQVYELKGAGL